MPHFIKSHVDVACFESVWMGSLNPNLSMNSNDYFEGVRLYLLEMVVSTNDMQHRTLYDPTKLQADISYP